MLFRVFLNCFTLLAASLFSFSNPLKINIGVPYFDFILDTETHTAELNKITIGSNEELDVVIPKEIEWSHKKYTVNSVNKLAFSKSFDKINSITIPETIENNQNNKKAFECIIKSSHIPLMEKLAINEHFK